MWKGVGESTNIGMSLSAEEARIVLIGICERCKEGWKERKPLPVCGKHLQKEIDLEDPTPSLSVFRLHAKRGKD